jgi:hypothetical protein
VTATTLELPGDLITPWVRVSSHIRQLLYIALHPPTYKGKEKPFFDPTASPSKLNRQQTSGILLSTATIAAAQRLLLAFAHTNSPEAVFRSVPRYALSTTDHLAIDEEELDSVVARDSLCIAHSRNAWEILKEGFVERHIATSNQSKKSRKATQNILDDQDDHKIGHIPIVGSNAWPILDWLLVVFERDEHFTEQSKKGMVQIFVLSW